MNQIYWVVHGYGVRFGVRMINAGWQVVYSRNGKFGVQGGVYLSRADAETAAFGYCSY